jgi:CspA family cold shock protein
MTFFSADKPVTVPISEEALRLQFEFVFEAIAIATAHRRAGVDERDDVVKATRAMLQRAEEVPRWMAENAANFRAAVEGRDAAKGYGFVLSDAGDVFVHHSAIEMDGYRTLEPGQVVEYEAERGPKGLLATRVIPLREAA